MTTEQQIEAHTAIAERFPDGRVDLPAERTASVGLAALDGLLDSLHEDAKLLGSCIVGDKIIIKYWI